MQKKNKKKVHYKEPKETFQVTALNVYVYLDFPSVTAVRHEKKKNSHDKSLLKHVICRERKKRGEKKQRWLAQPLLFSILSSII